VGLSHIYFEAYDPLIIVHIMFILWKEAKFMDEVEGIEVVHSPKREEIQEICQKMCSWERYV